MVRLTVDWCFRRSIYIYINCLETSQTQTYRMCKEVTVYSLTIRYYFSYAFGVVVHSVYIYFSRILTFISYHFGLLFIIIMLIHCRMQSW